MPAPTRAEQRRALAAGIARAHSLGVTSIQNASGNDEEFAALRGGPGRGRTAAARLLVTLGVARVQRGRRRSVRRHPPAHQERRPVQGRRREDAGGRRDRDQHRGDARPVCQQPGDQRRAELSGCRTGSHRAPARRPGLADLHPCHRRCRRAHDARRVRTGGPRQPSAASGAAASRRAHRDDRPRGRSTVRRPSASSRRCSRRTHG